jgi:hypothetical protein
MRPFIVGQDRSGIAICCGRTARGCSPSKIAFREAWTAHLIGAAVACGAKVALDYLITAEAAQRLQPLKAVRPFGFESLRFTSG